MLLFMLLLANKLSSSLLRYTDMTAFGLIMHWKHLANASQTLWDSLQVLSPQCYWLRDATAYSYHITPLSAKIHRMSDKDH